MKHRRGNTMRRLRELDAEARAQVGTHRLDCDMGADCSCPAAGCSCGAAERAALAQKVGVRAAHRSSCALVRAALARGKR